MMKKIIYLISLLIFMLNIIVLAHEENETHEEKENKNNSFEIIDLKVNVLNYEPTKIYAITSTAISTILIVFLIKKIFFDEKEI